MFRVTGLWKRTTQAGGMQLSGKLGSLRVVILENQDRHHKNDPDFIAYLDGKTDDSGVPAPGRRRAKHRPDSDSIPEAPEPAQRF